MKKIMKKNRGFTLVELLIVVLIIGALAGIMMVSSSSAADKAKANEIVSNLRNIKAAAMLYRADEGEYPTNINTSVDKYLGVDEAPANYTISNQYVKYTGTIGTGVAKALYDMRSEAGLKDADGSSAYDKGTNGVAMAIYASGSGE